MLLTQTLTRAPALFEFIMRPFHEHKLFFIHIRMVNWMNIIACEKREIGVGTFEDNLKFSRIATIFRILFCNYKVNNSTPKKIKKVQKKTPTKSLKLMKKKIMQIEENLIIYFIIQN